MHDDRQRTAALSRGLTVHCTEKQKPSDAAKQQWRNYSWSELMKRVFCGDARD
jgi:hypothetical protein